MNSRKDAGLGKYLGTAVSAEGDMFVTGHRYDVFENGVDHAQDCPCVDFVLPAA